MAVYILSGVSVIMFANKMYDYEKLRTLFPILKKVDPMYFVLAFLGGILITFILVKVSMYIYSNIENNKTVYNIENETDVVKTSGTAKHLQLEQIIKIIIKQGQLYIYYC